MIIVNINSIPGKEIGEALGIARGSTVRARNIGRDIFAGLKNIVGGEMEDHVSIDVLEDCEIQSTKSFEDLTFYTCPIRKGAFFECDVLYSCDEFLFCRDDYGYNLIERTDKLKMEFS